MLENFLKKPVYELFWFLNDYNPATIERFVLQTKLTFSFSVVSVDQSISRFGNVF